jgi:signal transduction histidine kinase
MFKNLNQQRIGLQSNENIAIAFSIVVFASYFSTFSTLQSTSTNEILLFIVLGISYLTLGVYGFSYCQKHPGKQVKGLYFFIQIILGSSIIYLEKGSGYNGLLLLPLVGHSVLLLVGLNVYLVNILLTVSYLLSNYLFLNSWSDVMTGFPIFFAGQVFIIVFIQMALDEERARIEVEKLINELAEANQTLRDYSKKVEELTLTRERNRLAREIHDGLGHALTTINMQIQAAKAIRKVNSQEADNILDSAQKLTRTAIIDVRNSVSSLRTTDISSIPIEDRIRDLVESARVFNLDSSFTLVGNPKPLTPAIDLVIFRSAQEGINNTCKHAKAAHLWVSLIFDNEQAVIRLIIKDDGIGLSSQEGGFGITGMRERAHLVDGELEIITGENKGTTLIVEVSIV